MTLKAIIFGGIGTLVETSELQRQAFNTAFEEAGLPWHWDLPLYRRLLYTPGGRNRIRKYSETRSNENALSEDLIAALHQRKTDLFHEALAATPLEPRRGAEDLIRQARNAGVKLAIASTTSESNIVTLLEASTLDMRDFDVILHRGDAGRPKPEPDIYRNCLDALQVTADQAVAVEDSDSGVESAVAAGLKCIALPGENTASHDFGHASLVVTGETRPDRPGRRFVSHIKGLTLSACEALADPVR